jgi:hypothetical protein
MGGGVAASVSAGACSGCGAGGVEGQSASEVVIGRNRLVDGGDDAAELMGGSGLGKGGKGRDKVVNPLAEAGNVPG